MFCIFAACSNMNERPKIQKKAENNEFLQLKNMNDNELKEWQTQSVKHKVAMVLRVGIISSYVIWIISSSWRLNSRPRILIPCFKL